MKDGTSNSQMKQLLNEVQQLQHLYIDNPIIEVFDVWVSNYKDHLNIDTSICCVSKFYSFNFYGNDSIRENLKELDRLRRFLSDNTAQLFLQEKPE